MNWTDEKPTHAYVARCRGCDAVIGLCVDMPGGRYRDTAEMVSGLIRQGLLVSCVPWGSQPPLEDCRCEKVHQEALPL